MNLTFKSSNNARLNYLNSLCEFDLNILADMYEQETGKTLKSRDYNKSEEEMHKDIIEELMTKDIREIVLANEALKDGLAPYEHLEELDHKTNQLKLNLENIDNLEPDFSVTRNCTKKRIIKALSLEDKSDAIEVTRELIKQNKSRYKKLKVNGLLQDELLKQLNSVDREDLIKAIDNTSHLFSAPDKFNDCKCVLDLISYVEVSFSDKSLSKIKKALKEIGINLRKPRKYDTFEDIVKEKADQIDFKEFKKIILSCKTKDDYIA